MALSLRIRNGLALYEYDLSFCDESGLMTGHVLARDVPSYLQGESSWEWGAVYHHLPRTPLVHRYSCYSSRHLRWAHQYGVVLSAMLAAARGLYQQVVHGHHAV